MYTIDYSMLNKGAVYKSFIRICCDYCDAFSLNVQGDYENNGEKFNANQFFLTMLSESEADIKETVYSPFNRISLYMLDFPARDFLMQAGAIDYFDFSNGFEDLCFYKNKRICFRSVSHEKIAFWESGDSAITSELKKLGLINNRR